MAAAVHSAGICNGACEGLAEPTDETPEDSISNRWERILFKNSIYSYFKTYKKKRIHAITARRTCEQHKTAPSSPWTFNSKHLLHCKLELFENDETSIRGGEVGREGLGKLRGVCGGGARSKCLILGP